MPFGFQAATKNIATAEQNFEAFVSGQFMAITFPTGSPEPALVTYSPRYARAFAPAAPRHLA